MKSSFIHRIRAARLLAGILFAAALPVFAQTAATGTIEGRVFNPANGSYLENARITVEGTAMETFTDDTGFYRIVNVPAGSAKLRASFTGMEAEGVVVTVAAGQTMQRDI